ncbi:beta strand repeat-containing protein [Arcobacter sp.]|uniref:beta strand repeat-containing protein n=1 Tax=unclassified Arcobacter TaxID=2593671 RepID=UPI003B0082B4
MKANVNYSSRFRILKGGKISLVVSALLGGVTLSFAAPSGGVVTSGTATISQNGNTTNINQSTSKASINWNKFNIASHETVNFNQPNVNSITLNRVIGNERSIIDGALNANGQVWILNSNGVLFGKNASINTSGLLATTKDISDTNFQKGNYSFTGGSIESVINQGTIKVKNNGYVIFASNEAKNSGTIEAVKGRVQLTSADEYTINLNGNSLIDLSIDKGTLDALVENSGTILADGGEVYLTTHAVDELLRGVVNNTGIIEANSLDGINGHVELYAHGGTANIAGTIKAKGGFVETSGKELSVASTTLVEASKWLLDPTDIVIESTGGSDITGASVSATAIESNLATTDIELKADNDITVNEDITWGEATKLTLTAGNEIYVNAIIENTNNTNGGVYFNAVNRNAAIKFDPTTGKVIINNINQLQWITQALNGRYELGSNIDASDTTTWNSGAGFKQIGDNSTYNIDTRFTGVFDGKGYIIDGLYINRGGENYVGLFGITINAATISNVGLTNVDITGKYGVGGLVGWNESSTITNSYVTGKVSGDTFVGGLVGVHESSTITNSYATGAVSGNFNVGGLVGGDNNTNSSITNSYATGKVSGNNNVGGLVGDYESSTITNSYWDIDTTEQTSGVGLGSSAGATGIYSSTNTKNAFDEATYAGFDFTNTWFMIEGETRPFLRSEYSTTITNDHQLQLMAMDLTADYVLANNIKYTGDMWSSKGFDSIGDSATFFQGSFDGKGYVIDGLYINRGNENYVGLFGQNWSSKSISNLGLTNVDITGKNYVGGLVGDALGLTINNSYVTGTINGHDNVGGLIGYGYNNNFITNSYTSVDITGNDGVGGLLGKANDGTIFSISNSYTTGTINGNNSVGGLMGSASSISISNSYSTASVFGSGNYIGGLVGQQRDTSTINNSYFSGDVTGNNNVGGLVGYADKGQINNSYFSGDVTGNNNVGGLVGSVSSTTINNSYSSGDVTGNNNVGGLVGTYDGYRTISNSYASGAITGVSRVGGVVGILTSTASITNSYWDRDTTGQTNGVGDGATTGTTGIYSSTNTVNAFSKDTYTGFDFTNDWIIYEGHTRPLLRAFMTEITVKANDATRTYDGTTYNGIAGVTYSNPTYDNSLVNGTLSYSGTGLKNAGTATINVDGLYSSQQGYIINYDTGTLTTNKKDITVTANSNTTTYNGTVQNTSGFTANGLVSGETVAVLDGVTGDSVSGKNAGTYNTNLSGTDENYNITFVDGSLDINKRALTLEAKKDYDGTDNLTGFVNFGNLVGAETLEYTQAKANSSNPIADNFIKEITLQDGTNGGLASNYELPSLLAYSANNSVQIGNIPVETTTTPDLSTVITPIANKTVLTNKDIDTLLKSGIDIKTILQQLDTNELALIPGIVMQVLNGGINLPYGSKQQFNLNQESEEEENTI